MSGIVVSVKDLVVRAQFDDDAPSVNELIEVNNAFGTKLLVDHLEPGGIAFCLNVRSDLRIMKGMLVDRTHKGIEIPIGDLTIGRILNALGDPLDGQPAVTGENLQY